MTANQRHQVIATRATFLLAGLALASWAPLVPFAKARLGIDDGTLGLLLLCLGLGSILAMPLAGSLAGRLGCRSVILTSAAVLVLVIPVLSLVDTLWTLAIALAVFGAAVGSIDVTMNIQATLVEKDTDRDMMSGFHGMFTLGSIAGAGGVSLLLSLGLGALAVTLAISALVAVLSGFAAPNLLPRRVDASQDTPMFVLPRGRVALIGLLCFVVFLAEGVVLDWGALFLIEAHAFPKNQAGLGYAAFAVAMTIGRFSGGQILQHFGAAKTLCGGAALAALGFLLAVIAPSGLLALAGFAAVGLGAANIVPIFFSAAGQQQNMPANLAISSVTTLGYAGILVGPALIGLLAQSFGLGHAILLVAVAMAAISVAGPLTVKR